MRPSTTFVPLFAALLPGLSAQDQAISFKDLVGSGKPIQFYGFVRMDAYYNTARASSVIIPATVLPEDTAVAKRNDDQFALDPRLTRFGMKINGGDYDGMKLSARLETDFANFVAGVAESRPTPRIRLAYIDIDNETWDFRIGQDWDTISPIYPAVNHELLMWNAGNLGDRRAQFRATMHSGPISWSSSLGLTGAINNQDLDAGSTFVERDGFDSGMPHLQTRLGYRKKPEGGGADLDLGVWGMFGRLETDTAFNGDTRFDTWVLGIDFQVPLGEQLTFRGEAWHGQALGDVRGGIGSTVNTAAASAGFGNEVTATGGWAEFVYQCDKNMRLYAGGTTDDPDADDLAPGNADLNLTGYVGTTVDINPDLRVAFDTIYWETDWLGVGTGNMVRFDLYFQFNF